MAVGVLLVSGLYIFLFVALRTILRKSQGLPSSPLLIGAVLGVVMAQGAISFLIQDEFDLIRFSQSYLLLIVFLLGAFFFALLAQRVPNFRADFAVKLVFYVLLLSSVAGILRFSPFSLGAIGKPRFFFSEPSHFVLSFLPFFLYMTVTASPRMKLPLVLLGYAIALLLQNLTFVVGIALVAVLVIPLRRFLLLAPIAALPILFAGVNLDYYSSRVDLFSGSQNLSTRVYLSGFERAYLNFKDTLGLGVGFQQFGIIGSPGESIEFIGTLMNVNLLDGATVASKFIGEFGFLSVTMLLAYLVYFAKSARWLHEVSMSEVAPRDCRRIFFLSCFVMYCIDLFIRGTGYFSSSGFLFIASLVWIRQSGNLRRRGTSRKITGSVLHRKLPALTQGSRLLTWSLKNDYAYKNY